MRKHAFIVGLLLLFWPWKAAQASTTGAPGIAYYTVCPNSSALNPGPWGNTPPYDYNCPVDPTSMIAGNTLIVSIGFDNAGGGQTWSVTDAQGDTFTQIASSGTVNSKQLLVFEATNIKGGESMIDIRLSGTLNGYWQPTITEFYNAAAVDATSCNTGTSASITAGSLTPTVPGDLLYQVSYYPNLSYGTAAQSSTYTAGSQANINWALWFALLGDGAAGQWGVYNSTAAINPSFTAPSSQSFISCAAALKPGTAGGGPNSAARRLNGMEIDAKPTNGSDPWHMAANITGHTVYVTSLTNATPSPTTCCAISSSPALSWTQSGPDGAGLNGHNHPEVYCATSANPIGPISLSLNLASPGTNDGIFVIYDVDGWGCSLDGDSGVLAGSDTSDVTPPLCVNCLTLTTQNDFIVGNMGEGFDTVVGVKTATNWTAVDDACYFTGVTINGYTQTCENNGFFHGTNGSSTGAITLILQDAAGAVGGTPAQDWAGRIAAYKPLTAPAGPQPPSGLTAIVQ
jgi:hypothetical protein